LTAGKASHLPAKRYHHTTITSTKYRQEKSLQVRVNRFETVVIVLFDLALVL